MHKYYVFKSWLKRALMAIFDATGGIICYLPKRIFHKPIDLNQVRRILVIRLDQMGDLLLTRPALYALQSSLSQAKIDLLLSSESVTLLDDEWTAGETYEFKHSWLSKQKVIGKHWIETLQFLKLLRKNKYDLAIDFRGDLRNILLMTAIGAKHRLAYGITGGQFLLTHTRPYPFDKHQVETNLDLLRTLDLKVEAQNKPLMPSKKRKDSYEERFENILPRSPLPRIVIHPGCGYASKQWPHTHFESLIHEITQKDIAQVVLIGSQMEKQEFFVRVTGDANHLVDLRGKTRLEDLPILFKQSHLFIGHDSGPAHLAAAQDLESIIVFSGANDSNVWRPWLDKLHLVRHVVPCSPCESSHCPLGHHDCMRKIPVDQVMGQVKKVLSQKVTGKNIQVADVS